MMENEVGDGVKAKQAIPISFTATRKFLGGITSDTSPISLQKWKDIDGITIEFVGRLKQVSNIYTECSVHGLCNKSITECFISYFWKSTRGGPRVCDHSSIT